MAVYQFFNKHMFSYRLYISQIKEYRESARKDIFCLFLGKPAPKNHGKCRFLQSGLKLWLKSETIDKKVNVIFTE